MKVTCLMAQTLDGKIARSKTHFPDWTETADKKYFRDFTKRAGVMIFGKTTFDTLPGVLPGRLTVVMSRRASDWDERQENLVFTRKSPLEILRKLKQLGYENPVVAGGAIINSLFARENLIDELVVTVSPVIFGEGFGVFEADVTVDLVLEQVEPLGENSLVLTYQVQK